MKSLIKLDFFLLYNIVHYKVKKYWLTLALFVKSQAEINYYLFSCSSKPVCCVVKMHDMNDNHTSFWSVMYPSSTNWVSFKCWFSFEITRKGIVVKEQIIYKRNRQITWRVELFLFIHIPDISLNVPLLMYLFAWWCMKQ